MSIVLKMKQALLLIATFFNIGRISKAPGTVATAATIPLWWALSQTGPIIYMIVVLLLVPLGIAAAQAYDSQATEHDAKEIVIDEVVGFLITMVWLPVKPSASSPTPVARYSGASESTSESTSESKEEQEMLMLEESGYFSRLPPVQSDDAEKD